MEYTNGSIESRKKVSTVMSNKQKMIFDENFLM